MSSRAGKPRAPKGRRRHETRDGTQAEDAEEDPVQGTDGAEDPDEEAEEAEEDLDAEGAVIETEAELVDDDTAPMTFSAAQPPASSRAITRADPLQAYMQQVQRHPLLTPDEEKRLAVEYVETGDVDSPY